MSRPAPPRVEPVIVESLRFEQNLSHPGFLFTVVDKSGEILQVMQVYPQKTGAALQEGGPYFKSLKYDEKKKSLTIVDEIDRSFQVSLEAAKKIRQWPARIGFVKAEKKDGGLSVVVELAIPNPGKKALRLDGYSVIAGGEMTNNLFSVAVDGKKIPYSGMMKKRAEPATFIAVKPGETYKAEVDLGRHYEFPANGKTAIVHYEIFNAYSPDKVMFVSNELQFPL